VSNIVNNTATVLPNVQPTDLTKIVELYNQSKRPILLLGGGVNFDQSHSLSQRLTEKNIPVMTTYNGADRVDGFSLNYLGRPNTWGQRSSNIIIQNSDLIIAVGTRLGLQQTGFNWEEFGRNATIVQVDIDEAELNKGHPIIDIKLPVDANHFLERFINSKLESKTDWLLNANKIRSLIPRIEDINHTGDTYISPYNFIADIEEITTEKDVIIPCSSGSAFTLSMQLYKQKLGQRLVTNKSLASMGYGLSGAVGACIAANNKRRTILIEGDGGFAQNMQEMGTVGINKLNIKVFIFHDQGHASIRMTQQNYFDGKYLGCDRSSGLGLPNWTKLFDTWDIPVLTVNKGFAKSAKFLKAFETDGPHVFVVEIDPEQTYLPKISSKVMPNGSMKSNPIDAMSPALNETLKNKIALLLTD
jgi:acetolactate synthase-1/2/3 large subunit